MLLWKFLTTLLLLHLIAGQPCQPKFTIPFALQDVIDLTNFINAQSTSTAEYSYPFSGTYFQQVPSALVSLGALHLQNHTKIDYLLSTSVLADKVVIRFTSNNMIWTSVRVHLILHSRTDIKSYLNTYDVVAGIKMETMIVSGKPQGTSSFFAHHILGIKAVPAPSYNFNIEDIQIATGNPLLSLNSNTNCTFTIQTIIIDSLIKTLAFGAKQIAWNSGLGLQHTQLWMQFAPVAYVLMGFSKLQFSGDSLDVEMSLDIINNGLTVGGSNGVTKMQILVFALGVPAAEVCAPCDNYISVRSCSDQCASGNYPYSFANGGKVCRMCVSQLGQSLSTDGISCQCNNGQLYFQGNCYQPSNMPPHCNQDQLNINNQCIKKDQSLRCPTNSYPNSNYTACICNNGLEMVASECRKPCPSNSQRTTYGICACNYGFIMTSSKQCESICPVKSVYRSDLKICKCNYNYQMVNGVCSECPKGQIYDPTTSKCLAAFQSISQVSNQLTFCKTNQIVVNNQCVCDRFSVLSNGKCSPCPLSTFKDGPICNPCSNYCRSCQSSTVCNTCDVGFDLMMSTCSEKCGDGRRFVVECDDGNNKDGDGCSSMCTVERGYLCGGGTSISTDVCQRIDPTVNTISIRRQDGFPIYTSSGIVIDFVVEPPVVRSQTDLTNMFIITFSNPNARPNNIFLSQSPNDAASIRCMFSYNNHLPSYQPFNVIFVVQDMTYGSAHITLLIDTIGNKVTSAIRRGKGGSDVLK